MRELKKNLPGQRAKFRDAEQALDLGRKEESNLQSRFRQAMASREQEVQQAVAVYQREIAELRVERDRLAAMRGTKLRRAEVLRLLHSGTLTDREIARRAGVSPTTVGNLRRGANSGSCRKMR